LLGFSSDNVSSTFLEAPREIPTFLAP
jgi:hypothetical protein